MTNLGFALLEQGEVDLARPYLEDSLTITRADANPFWSKFPLSILGGLHVRAGAFAQAQACYEESLSINRTYQDLEGVADSLHGLAKAVNAQGAAAGLREKAGVKLTPYEQARHEATIAACQQALPAFGVELAVGRALTLEQAM